jgi:hypothetical protein
LNFAFNGGKDIFFEFVAGEFGGGDEGRKEIDKEFPAITFSVREDLESGHTSPTRAQLVHQLVSRTLITTWELRHPTNKSWVFPSLVFNSRRRGISKCPSHRNLPRLVHELNQVGWQENIRMV